MVGDGMQAAGEGKCKRGGVLGKTGKPVATDGETGGAMTELGWLLPPSRPE